MFGYFSGCATLGGQLMEMTAEKFFVDGSETGGYRAISDLVITPASECQHTGTRERVINLNIISINRNLSIKTLIDWHHQISGINQIIIIYWQY